MPMLGTLPCHSVINLDKAILGYEVALGAAAFDDLLAKLHSQLALGTPSDGAKAERGFTFKTQPEAQGQVLGLWQFQERPVLRYVAHDAVQVFTLTWVGNRSRDKSSAPRGTAPFNKLIINPH